MKSQTERRRQLVENYIRPVIQDKRIVQTFLEIPRHKFVPADLQDSAYADSALPIGEGQTISQPSLVALMTLLLEPKETDIVLEVGTGSGYQAAILSRLVKAVYTVEIIEKLYKSAKERLKKYGNVETILGNGSIGYKKAAPYDAIIVTAAANRVPAELEKQLKIGGRLIAPVGEKHAQTLLRGVKTKKGIDYTEIETVSFVPLVGKGTGH